MALPKVYSSAYEVIQCKDRKKVLLVQTLPDAVTAKSLTDWSQSVEPKPKQRFFLEGTSSFPPEKKKKSLVMLEEMILDASSSFVGTSLYLHIQNVGASVDHFGKQRNYCI